MNSIIIFFGLVVATIGMLMLLQPRLVMDTVYSFAAEKWLQVATATLRLILGSVLLACAEQTRFPLTLQIIGLVGLIAGMSVALMPYMTFHQLTRRLLKHSGRHTRLIALGVMGFGLFLVYAMF